jgi:hypothetical protein
LHPCSLEDLVAQDHPVRVVWAFVLGMDLSPLYEGIRALEGHAGRPAIEPTVLVALWLYATIDGVGAGRVCAPNTRLIAGCVVGYRLTITFTTVHFYILLLNTI